MNRKSHSLQLLLPLCLLAGFILTACLTVLLSASAYRDILDRSNRLTESTALTYIGEKVCAGSVHRRLPRSGHPSGRGPTVRYLYLLL